MFADSSTQEAAINPLAIPVIILALMSAVACAQACLEKSDDAGPLLVLTIAFGYLAAAAS
jgi:hypothetical protein